VQVYHVKITTGRADALADDMPSLQHSGGMCSFRPNYKLFKIFFEIQNISDLIKIIEKITKIYDLK
jgi:hypothetical protein